MAYQAILEGLFTRKVPAGAYLSQNDLVRLLGLPVQPLRDALRILETEGVLTIHPRAGIEFLKPDLELARSTYQFRTMIERTAARTYAESADPLAIAKLLKDHETLIKQITAKDSSRKICRSSKRSKAACMGRWWPACATRSSRPPRRRLKNYLILIKLDRRITAPLALRTLREHVEILEACVRHDADQAEAALVRHFQSALQRIFGMS